MTAPTASGPTSSGLPESYAAELDRLDMAPLWTVLADLVPPAVPALGETVDHDHQRAVAFDGAAQTG